MHTRIMPSLIAAGIAISAAHRAHADDSFSLLPRDQTPSWAEQFAADQPKTIPDVSPPAEYGTQGSRWMSIGSAISSDLGQTVDVDGHLSITQFIAQDVEVGFEGAVWGLFQEGDDAAGVSGSFIIRWHFYHEGPWTVFLDAGIGALASTDNVPAEGTSLNFLPRGGIGLTHAIEGGPARLIAGVQYHHISNARILGDDANPARDLPLIYAGVVFPF